MEKQLATFEDFSRLDIRVGTITEAKTFEKARRPAYQLWVDLGEEIGVKKTSAQITDYYKPEDLVGKTVVAVTNLAPRKMMGQESCGMLLSAEKHDKLQLIILDDAIEAGAKFC